jgi:hypothetical protein
MVGVSRVAIGEVEATVEFGFKPIKTKNPY